MCRWLAYSGPPIFLEELIVKPSRSLLVQSRFARENWISGVPGIPEGDFPTNGDGFGIGWYGERDWPGLYRDLRPAWSDENLLGLAQQPDHAAQGRLRAGPRDARGLTREVPSLGAVAVEPVPPVLDHPRRVVQPALLARLLLGLLTLGARGLGELLGGHPALLVVDETLGAVEVVAALPVHVVHQARPEVMGPALGPGRIHHCMRAIGAAEYALELMCKRAVSRTAFGRPLAKLGGNYDKIANARINIDMARLLTLQTAHVIDTRGVQEAQVWISKIKALVPNVALQVIDDAIQIHGAAGISQDFPLAHMYANTRTLRFADGPDEVHMSQLGKLTARERRARESGKISYLVGQYASLIDHLMIRPAATSEWLTASTVIYDPGAAFDDYTSVFSDHAAIWASFATDRDDD